MQPVSTALGDHRHVRVGVSRDSDTAAAVNAVLDEIDADDAALVLVFFAPQHDAEVAARILKERVGDRALGGTTAGEMSRCGFTHDAVTAIAWEKTTARAAVTVIPQITAVSLVTLSSLPRDLAGQLSLEPGDLDPTHHLWLLLFDGLSRAEEMITPFFARHAPNAPVVGGSLADGDEFRQVKLVHNGHVYSDAAASVLLEYRRPFELLHHTHMEFTDTWFDVTRVSNDGRCIIELDGRPAVEPYAEALGVPPEQLSGKVLGASPLGLRFRGKPFPCSVMRVNPDGSLIIAYAIQAGERVALLRSVNMVSKSYHALMAAIESVKANGGVPQALLLFHCLGRYYESANEGTLPELFEALDQLPICGLNTYGEQFASMHMNHSMTGVVFG